MVVIQRISVKLQKRCQPIVCVGVNAQNVLRKVSDFGFEFCLSYVRWNQYLKSPESSPTLLSRHKTSTMKKMTSIEPVFMFM